MSETPRNQESPEAGKLLELIHTVHRLRAPGGCPWDRAQTHQSLRQYLTEESYEVLEVLDRIDKDEVLESDEKVRSDLREELGDLLLQILLHSEMANERKAFSIYDVAKELNDKLVRRHPHVFADTEANTAEQALGTWEKQKAKEKAKKNQSVLDGLPLALPALQRTLRLIEKVTKVGFQWENMDGPIEKFLEEISEFEKEVRGDDRDKMEDELGDVLFTVCNLAYLKKLNPEQALRRTLAKFEKRFRFVEEKLREQGKTPDESTLEEMDRFWDEAKSGEK